MPRYIKLNFLSLKLIILLLELIILQFFHYSACVCIKFLSSFKRDNPWKQGFCVFMYMSVSSLNIFLQISTEGQGIVQGEKEKKNKRI